MSRISVTFMVLLISISRSCATPWHDYPNYSNYPASDHQFPIATSSWQDAPRYPYPSYSYHECAKSSQFLSTAPDNSWQNVPNYHPNVHYQRPTMNRSPMMEYPRLPPANYQAPMTAYDHSMPSYGQTMPSSMYHGRDTINHAYGPSNNDYSNGYRYDSRSQPPRDMYQQPMHPHYYSEKNLMSFK